MQPIEIKISGHSSKPPQEICDEMLNLQNWPQFQGYGILPGIKKAEFENRTPNLVGSRIRVLNTDGSSHVEEILAWEPTRRVQLKFQNFSPPTKNVAEAFVETWQFETSSHGTAITRSMSMFPKGFLGWLALLPISRLMKKAFEESARQQAG